MQMVGETGLALPHFLVIGAQKAGTTSLHEWLRVRPDVFLPASKETHYFSLFTDQPLSWYAAHYAAALPHQLRGDITPYYAFHPMAAAWIAATLPAVRLVLLVRDPVERALSHYFHEVRRGKESLPIAEAFAAEAERLATVGEALRVPGARSLAHQCHSYTARSRYDEQIRHYQRFFSPEQLLVVRSEDMFAHTRATMQRILLHIGIADTPHALALPQANAGTGEHTMVSPALRAQLRTTLEPTYRWMAAHYDIRWDA